MLIIYSVILIVLALYSYCLMDLNFTLVNSNIWAGFRQSIIHFGYYQRTASFIVYFLLVFSLFIIGSIIVARYKKVNPLTIALIVSCISLFAYPFLSHDFFNYIFDAKIFTFYHKNPYLFKALDFPHDNCTRFMHWTHRTYPYGPVFLIISFIPSFFAFGKFILNYFFFKLFFIACYLLTVFILNKMNKKIALFYATNPFVIVEGLFSPHNDFVAILFSVIAVYFLFKKKKLYSSVFSIFSAGVKYITLPCLFLSKRNPWFNKFVLTGLVLVIVIVSLKGEIQPWYFANIFIFLPIYEDLVMSLNLMFFGLLISYHPFIVYGDWSRIYIKHNIIYLFIALNLVYLIFRNRSSKV